jgi:hypothetical protein
MEIITSTQACNESLFDTILEIQLPEQSVPITSKVVSSNPALGEV